ncbi:sensor histidine kinase [Thermosediminibacter oceani]|uniref:histidine kinase n=1 Tax=Thermosediminibacter oceani (strain ATCC BAA-1034 / DSM 16646 / JW/IW-1228P) TaxID=555079 RepID=D9S067_THEOJ|nr:sensor histidine kinase [Thermosediminibacter oceani]ADL06995.1 signal transduction histidine kinase, LytS [Thermosediminibacter oceani DSM 16646]
MVYSILAGLADRLGLFIVIAYLLSKNRAFKNLILKHRVSLLDKILLSAVFGAFGILGTYMGIPVYGALANSRAVGVIIGGLLGGPLVGVLSGFVAGFHRWAIDVGGFTALACGLSTFTEGTIAGLLHRKLNHGKICWKTALFIGMALELLQMVIILLVAKPFSAALALVKVIGFPMTSVNAIGIAIFIIIVENIFREQERVGAYQAQLALDIASETLPYLRQGLSEFSAYRTAKIIYEKADYDAVAITDNRQILAHIGVGEDHHRNGLKVLTRATRRALETGECQIASNKEEIECSNGECPLKSAVIVPLVEKDRVIGCLKLYRTRDNSITSIDIRLAQGLAQLFSTQLELSRMEHQARLLAKAELRALQSQINPHFLFNALNTIVSICRKDPEQARALLIYLGEFFRKNLSSGRELVPLEQEIEHVKAYLAIEQARFGERLKVVFEIDPVTGVMVPPLILQPLVENAVKHGLLPKKEGGTVIIKAKNVTGGMEITVADDGMGMDEDTLKGILLHRVSSDRIGLCNVNERLESLYGEESRLKVSSKPMLGTVVKFFIPAAAENWREADGAYGATGR